MGSREQGNAVLKLLREFQRENSSLVHPRRTSGLGHTCFVCKVTRRDVLCPMGHGKIHPRSHGWLIRVERNPDFLTHGFQMICSSLYRDWSSLWLFTLVLFLCNGCNETVVWCSLKGRGETHATQREWMLILRCRGARSSRIARCCLDLQRPVCRLSSRMKASRRLLVWAQAQRAENLESEVHKQLQGKRLLARKGQCKQRASLFHIPFHPAPSLVNTATLLQSGPQARLPWQLCSQTHLPVCCTISPVKWTPKTRDSQQRKVIH